MISQPQRATLIDGKAIAKKVRSELATKVAVLLAEHRVQPRLATILVGENPASESYVRAKHKACKAVGIASEDHRLAATVPEKTLLQLLDRLVADPEIHGILLQLPLPGHMNAVALIDRIPPHKDVDGFHPQNVGALVLGRPGLRSCTPLGVMRMLAEIGTPLTGTRALVVGRSAIVGKPMAALLLAQNATVTMAHSHTLDLKERVAEAELLVVAMGKPMAIRGEWIREGATVIDVGINRLADGSLVGDVDFEAARSRAAAITPVPFGVGPMTISMLLSNTYDAARAALDKP